MKSLNDPGCCRTPPWEILANWHVKPQETRHVRPSQSMVVLQLLVWLCRPMRECQSLRHMGQMKLKEGKVELFLRRARFSSAFWWRFTFAFLFLLSLSVSSEHDQSQHQYNTIQYNTIQCSLFWEGRYMINPVKSFLTHGPLIFPVVWINFACFEVRFASVHEPQGGAPDFPDSCY